MRVKNKEKILKAKRKTTHYSKRAMILINVFSLETTEARSNRMILKSWKLKKITRIFYPAKLSLKNEGNIKIF